MNRKLVILGGGESGAGAAVLGRLKGYDVFVSDCRTHQGQLQKRIGRI
jgi:UDP-N-acetylmuramoylalanine--D-glutamate ligase